MFYQFGVQPEQRDFLRFICWQNDDLATKPITYRMTVYLFGAVSSPGCANFGLKKAADLGEEKYGVEAARFVREDFSVDDGLASRPTVTEAINLVRDTKKLCAEYGIKLYKFVSNSHKVLEAITPNELAKCLENITFDRSGQNQATERVLGMSGILHQIVFNSRLRYEKDR